MRRAMELFTQGWGIELTSGKTGHYCVLRLVSLL